MQNILDSTVPKRIASDNARSKIKIFSICGLTNPHLRTEIYALRQKQRHSRGLFDVMRETFLVQASGFDFSLALVILSRFLESKNFCARTGCAQAAPPYSDTRVCRADGRNVCADSF
jgi:hypothetical protein